MLIIITTVAVILLRSVTNCISPYLVSCYVLAVGANGPVIGHFCGVPWVWVGGGRSHVGWHVNTSLNLIGLKW